jgi:hypothetical protein
MHVFYEKKNISLNKTKNYGSFGILTKNICHRIALTHVVQT